MGARRKWPTDHGLITACRRGDAPAWETLIRRYRRLIFSIPVAYRLSPGDAEEIFQRVTVKLFEHLGRIKRAESLPAWLIVTTRRECQAYSRGARRWDSIDALDSGSLSEDPKDVAAALDAVRSEHALALALERMDETCRELLSALYLEEPTPSYAEISSRLQRPVGSLGPTRARCLRKLRTLFLEAGGEKT